VSFSPPEKLVHVGTLFGLGPIERSAYVDGDTIRIAPVLPTAFIFDHRLIDGADVLRPCGALRFTNVSNAIRLTLLTPASMGLTPMPVTITGPAAGLTDLAFGADSTDAYALVNTSLTGGATQLRRVNLANGDQVTIGTLTGLRGIAVGRDGSVYAHDSTSVTAYRPDGSLAASVTPAAAPSSVAYDDVRDRVVVLSVPRRTVTAYSKALVPVAELVIPAAIPVSGAGSVAVSPEVMVGASLTSVTVIATACSAEVFTPSLAVTVMS
jgi:hypothetical protein